MPEPTYYAKILINELRNKGLKIIPEYHDGHKSVDIFIPEVNLEVEVDGRHHYEEISQAYSDLLRQSFSMKSGRRTIRLSNNLIYNKPEDTAEIIFQLVKDLRKEKENMKKPKKEKVSEVLEKSFIKKYKIEFKNFDLKKAGRNTLKGIDFFYKYMKTSIFISIVLIISLFLFPFAYYIFAYTLLIVVTLIAWILMWLISFLFSKDYNLLTIKFEHGQINALLEITRLSAPKVWSFIYGANTKPTLVITLIIVSFIIGFFKMRK